MATREETDRYFGHPGFVGSEHPLAAGNGQPSRVRGIDRFHVYVVYRDGVPREVSKWDYLGDALDDADREWKANEEARYDRTNCHVGVYDFDDPELGDLDRDYLDEHDDA